MIKKIMFVILFCFAVISCGKKGDPEYKALNKEVNSQTILISKA